MPTTVDSLYTPVLYSLLIVPILQDHCLEEKKNKFITVVIHTIRNIKGFCNAIKNETIYRSFGEGCLSEDMLRKEFRLVPDG